MAQRMCKKIPLHQWGVAYSSTVYQNTGHGVGGYLGELSVLVHLHHDVAAAEELAVDVKLRDGRPAPASERRRGKTARRERVEEQEQEEGKRDGLKVCVCPCCFVRRLGSHAREGADGVTR
eukprot:2247322-Rhodomonas_salina.1